MIDLVAVVLRLVWALLRDTDVIGLVLGQDCQLGTQFRQVQSCDLLVEVLKRMTAGRFRHMPVMENGAMSGMISIGDAVSQRLLELEEEALQLKQLIVG